MTLTLSKYALQRDYFIETGKGLRETDVVAYLAALKRVAEVGGVSIEEKNFEDAIIPYLGIRQSIVKKATKVASDKTKSTSSIVSKVKDKGFRICLLRDIYRMALADGKVSKIEKKIIDDCAVTLGISPNLELKIVNHVDNEVKLLRNFSEIIKSTVK